MVAFEMNDNQVSDGQHGTHCGLSRAIISLVSSTPRKTLKYLKKTFSLIKNKFSGLLKESSEGSVPTHISEVKVCRVGDWFKPWDSSGECLLAVLVIFHLPMCTPIREASRDNPNLSLLAKDPWEPSAGYTKSWLFQWSQGGHISKFNWRT